MRARRLTAPLFIALLSCGLIAGAEGPSRRFRAGRPLTEALAALRPMGLEVIYSSDLVRPGMRVLAEPVASTPRGILEDLIVPHGLAAREGPGGTLLVVVDEAAAGPTGAVTGRVLTGGRGRAAPGAHVSVPGTEVDVLTAEDGRFLIHRLPPGQWPLDVRSADKGAQQSVEVSVKAGEATRLAIELAPAPTLIEEIVVTPTRHQILGDDPEARQTIQGEELARLAHLGDDAQRAPARLPGTAAGDKSAKFSLRGGDWNEVLVVLDGLEIDEPYHLEEFLAFSGIVDSQAIERVDVLAGGFPVEYGGRMSGVMEMTSSSPSDGAASVGAGLPNSRALIEGTARSGAAGWLLAARAWYPDALVDLVDPGGEDVNPYYYDLMGKAALRFDRGTTISAHVLAARDRLDFSGEEREEGARARYNTTYAWINIASPWTARLFSLTQVSAGAVETDRSGNSEDPGQGRARVDDERVSRFSGIKQEWLFRGSERLLTKWGFDARDLDADYEYVSHLEIDDPIFTPAGAPLVVDRGIVSRPSGSRLGAYAAVKARLLPSLTAEAGLRWEKQTYADDSQLDPRVNLVWAAGERSTLRAAWGLFHQPQRIDELQVEDGVEEFLPAQLSEHRLVSFEHGLASGLHVRVDAYWKSVSHPRPRFENLFNPIELFPDLESDRVRIAPRRAAARGVEAYLRDEPSAGIGWRAGYALAVAEDDVGGRTEPRSWDQRHAVNAGLSWRWGAGWELDLAGAWHSGWPTTRVDARAVSDPNGMVRIQPTLGRRNAERFSPYHRLDLRLTRHVPLPLGRLVMFLEVLNLYDRNNVCCVERFSFDPDPDGSVRVERHEGFWLERLPSLGLTWEF